MMRVKNVEHWKKFLRKMERTPEFAIKSVMGDKGYVDTPGFYQQERRQFNNDVVLFMKSNMSSSSYEKLKKWYIKNPEKAKEIMKL